MICIVSSFILLVAITSLVATVPCAPSFAEPMNNLSVPEGSTVTVCFYIKNGCDRSSLQITRNDGTSAWRDLCDIHFDEPSDICRCYKPGLDDKRWKCLFKDTFTRHNQHYKISIGHGGTMKFYVNFTTDTEEIDSSLCRGSVSTTFIASTTTAYFNHKTSSISSTSVEDEATTSGRNPWVVFGKDDAAGASGLTMIPFGVSVIAVIVVIVCLLTVILTLMYRRNTTYYLSGDSLRDASIGRSCAVEPGDAEAQRRSDSAKRHIGLCSKIYEEISERSIEESLRSPNKTFQQEPAISPSSEPTPTAEYTSAPCDYLHPCTTPSPTLHVSPTIPFYSIPFPLAASMAGLQAQTAPSGQPQVMVPVHLYGGMAGGKEAYFMTLPGAHMPGAHMPGAHMSSSWMKSVNVRMPWTNAAAPPSQDRRVLRSESDPTRQEHLPPPLPRRNSVLGNTQNFALNAISL